jgi:hypothetical protein
MGYVKNAMMDCHEAGCLWLDDDVINNLRAAGHNPQTKRVIVEGFGGPVELDAVLLSDGLRLLGLAEGDDREMIADELSYFL